MISLLSQDIHSHILPGVDDGFREVSDSLEAVRRLSAAGCRDLTFTPHLNPEVYPDMTEGRLREVYDAFVAQIPAELGVTTHLAAEYMVVPDFERRIPPGTARDSGKAGGLLAFADGTILVEMSYYYRSANLESALFALSMAGYKPVLAHPERYSYMAGSLKDFERWRDMGCRFQFNYMSLTGKYGSDSVKIMKHLFKEGFYDFAATDLHSIPQLESILAGKPVFTLRSAFRRWQKNAV